MCIRDRAGTVDSVIRVNKRNSGKRFISQPQKETLSTLVITHPCNCLLYTSVQRRQGVGVLVLMRPFDYPLNAQARFSQNLSLIHI